VRKHHVGTSSEIRKWTHPGMTPPRWLGRKFRLFIVGLVVLIASPASPAASTAEIMHDVLDSLAYLLPLSARESNYDTQWDAELIDSKLKVLAGASSAMAAHSPPGDEHFSLLARAFDKSVQDITVSFQHEWPEYAYYSLLELTEHCANCHRRLQAQSRNEFGQKLLARMHSDDLAPGARLSVLLATREFDHALTLLEGQLMDPAIGPVEATYRGYLRTYLRVALSTGSAVARIADFLRNYRARTDQPLYLRQQLDNWLGDLARHEQALGDEPTLAYARASFNKASTSSLIPGHANGVINDLVAARMMREWLTKNADAPSATRADIYYHLAVVALRTTGLEPTVPEMEMLLVACIEADPGGPYAVSAYHLLEEYGYVQEEHLAQQKDSQILIDMSVLRQQVGLGTGNELRRSSALTD